MLACVLSTTPHPWHPLLPLLFLSLWVACFSLLLAIPFPPLPHPSQPHPSHPLVALPSSLYPPLCSPSHLVSPYLRPPFSHLSPYPIVFSCNCCHLSLNLPLFLLFCNCFEVSSSPNITQSPPFLKNLLMRFNNLPPPSWRIAITN